MNTYNNSYITFKEFVDLSKETDDYQSYLEAINLFEQDSKGLLQEDILANLAKNIKEKFDFIKEISGYAKIKLEDLIVLFKDSKIYQLFKEFRWDIVHIGKIVKEGFDLYKSLHDIVFVWMKDHKIVKWTDDKVKEIQQFLIKHPKLKKIGGIVVAGLLLFALIKGTDIGHPFEDFDLTPILQALQGHYDLSDVFGGVNGIKFLTYLLNGIFGVGLISYGFDPATTKLIPALILTIAKLTHKKLKKDI